MAGDLGFDRRDAVGEQVGRDVGEIDGGDGAVVDDLRVLQDEGGGEMVEIDEGIDFLHAVIGGDEEIEAVVFRHFLRPDLENLIEEVAEEGVEGL